MTDTPDPIDVEVGLAIRTKRRELHISQDQLGKALGITFQQVQKYERGTNRVSASMLVKTARVLGMHPSDLLPATDAAPLKSDPAIGARAAGADRLLAAYGKLSPAYRKAVVALAEAMARAAVEGRGD